MEKELNDLFGLDWKPVGSRETCSPPPLDTDIDYLCLVKRSIYSNLKDLGFTQEGSPQFYTGNDRGAFSSWRKGDVNLIITPDIRFYDLFLTATYLAKKHNLLKKEDRIQLFQAVLYDVALDNLVLSSEELDA